MIALSACSPNRLHQRLGSVLERAGRASRLHRSAAVTALFTDVSPFFFSAQPDGTIALVGTRHANSTRRFTRRTPADSRCLPSITDGSGKLVMAAHPCRPGQPGPAHRQHRVAHVTYPEIDGVDLDYEGFAFTDGHASWATTQPLWDAFVTELATALHNNGKLLSVTIPPTWMAAGVEHRLPRVRPGLRSASYADRVRLMVYDWSVSSPGPISPMSWVNQVIAYSNPMHCRTTSRSCNSASRRTVATGGARSTRSEICPDGALSTSSIELQNMQALIDAQGATPTAPRRVG